MKNKLIGMEFVVEVIQTVLLTGQLADEKPVSLLIIASPESGKTTTARKANISVNSEKHGQELAVALADTTGMGLLKIIREHPKATHIIFNDLSITTGHKRHVARYLFGLMGALTEEGIARTADPEGIHTFSAEEGLKGIIACITPRLVHDQRFIWNATGLTSRMLPFYYDQGLDVQLKAKRYRAGLAEHLKLDGIPSLPVPEEKVRVSVKRKYREQILKIADDIAEKLSREMSAGKKHPKDYEEIGYRRIDQFMALAKANSLLTHPADIDDEPTVHKVNVKFLRKLSRFVSYRHSEELEDSSSSDEQQ